MFALIRWRHWRGIATLPCCCILLVTRYCFISDDMQIDELVEGTSSGSPNLTPLDYFLWGSKKSRVYGTPVMSGGGPYCTSPRSDCKPFKKTTLIGSSVRSSAPPMEALQWRRRYTVWTPFVTQTARCAAHVRFIDDMWNGHFDALQRPNRAVPDMGSVLKNNQLAVLHTILFVVGVFWAPCILI